MAKFLSLKGDQPAFYNTVLENRDFPHTLYKVVKKKSIPRGKNRYNFIVQKIKFGIQLYFARSMISVFSDILTSNSIKGGNINEHQRQ